MKEYYCKKIQNHSYCMYAPIIKGKNTEDSNPIHLSHVRFYNKRTKDIFMNVYVKMSIYNKLKRNYITLTDKQFNAILKILKTVNDELIQKGSLLEKANNLFKEKNLNIDLKQGVLVESGICFFNDNSDKMIKYIKFATGEIDG